MYKKVLIPVDVSVQADTEGLLQTAKSITELWGSDVHVVTVIPNVGMPIVGSFFDDKFEGREHVEVAEKLREVVIAADLKAEPHILFGTAYDQVIGLAKKLDVDLIIIGAHQPDLKDYLLGSNAARVVRHSNTSVLVVRNS